MADTWHTAYVAFGSNMGDKKQHIDNGIACLKNNSSIKVTKVSDYMATPPYGYLEQDEFLNGCLELMTTLSPEELLKELLEIELKESRRRVIHWGPRTLDLDLIFYDDVVLGTDFLVLPHPDMQNRHFVLDPLKQIAPDVRHPVLGKTVSELKTELDSKNA